MKTNLTNNTKVKYKTAKNYQKHFTLDDRTKIQKIIFEHRDSNGELTILLKDIGAMLQNDPSSISKEIKKNRVFKARPDYSSFKPLNSLCANYNTCTKFSTEERFKHCYLKAYTKCISFCKEFEEIICPNLLKFPWVCNGCPKSFTCRLNKYYYFADIAQKGYKTKLIESREGINLTPDEFNLLDHIVSEYVRQKQPVYHIVSSHELPVCERTIYNYIEKGYLSVKNIDLRRKVTYKKRSSNSSDESKTILKKIKIGRTYEDYQKYILEHPNASIVEMDTVISAGDCKRVLLTLHFVKYHFQLAFLLENKEAININSTIDMICDEIGIENFKLLFEVILTDNGTEFSNPKAMEFHPETGEERCHVFFCNPYSSYEKGHCEKNHEYIRYVLPKGTVFDFLTQEKVNTMMSHINSTIRPSLKSSPYDFMLLAYGQEILNKFQIKKIDSKLVSLSIHIIK